MRSSGWVRIRENLGVDGYRGRTYEDTGRGPERALRRNQLFQPFDVRLLPSRTHSWCSCRLSPSVYRTCYSGPVGLIQGAVAQEGFGETGSTKSVRSVWCPHQELATSALSSAAAGSLGTVLGSEGDKPQAVWSPRAKAEQSTVSSFARSGLEINGSKSGV